ncbi:MAG: single-stranded-DNA-specific exonuclease RecJ [Planctomycetota bacterium]|jgi:single-stranded-DNA-specific exonuclease
MTQECSPTSVPEPDPRERALAHTVGQPDLMARILLARGFEDPKKIRGHLNPNLSSLHDPFSFSQMEKAVERIRRAISGDERILIHGDYDVDGITGTVLLLKLFKLVGADAKPFIPTRKDGYSFTDASVRAVREGKYTVCISVDNGTNACRHIDEIQRLGCDVIVTDHHGTTDNVADAYAVLNPRLKDAGYPDRELAGVGVAFRLASAIAKSFSQTRSLSDEFREFLLDSMALVALGTVADVAPLRGENRVMTFHGLRALAASRNPGIRALLDSAGLSNRSPDAEDIAFRIAPLINAAGRMGSALEAVRLFTADGYSEAQEAAKILEKHNRKRRDVEKELLELASAQAAGSQDRVLVLAGDGWHAGVMGIVAARLAETLLKPTLLISFDGDLGRGSGRTPPGFHLREALRGCGEQLIQYGGHAAAAGLEIDRSNLDAFKKQINKVAAEMKSSLTPIPIDGSAEFAELEPQLLRKLDQLGPFGSGNPRPTFASRGVKLVGSPHLDSRGRDLRIRVAQSGIVIPARLRSGARHFEVVRELKSEVEIVYTPRINRRGEDGPVELYILQLRQPKSAPTADRATSNPDLVLP